MQRGARRACGTPPNRHRRMLRRLHARTVFFCDRPHRPPPTNRELSGTRVGCRKAALEEGRDAAHPARFPASPASYAGAIRAIATLDEAFRRV